MNLNFFESSEIKKFLNSKEKLTFDEKKELVSFIESRKKSLSFDDKKEIVNFINKSIDSSEQITAEKIDSSEIITEVLNKIRADESFVISINENHVELISETVAERLKNDLNFTKQLIGPSGKDGEPGVSGQMGQSGKTGPRGLTGKVNSKEIVNILKNDNDFINAVRQGQTYWYAGGGGGPSVQEIVDLIHQYGGGGTVSGSYVSTINSTSGDILLSAGSNVEITQLGNTFVFSASTTSVSAGVETINSVNGNIILSAGPNINISTIDKTITISAANTGTGSNNSYFPSGW